MDGGTAVGTAPDDARRASVWKDRHPGWAIEQAGRWYRVLDPARTPQAFELELGTLLGRLEQADEVTGSGNEDEQKARLREAFGSRWSLGVDHSRWEALPSGCLRPDLEQVEAPEAWLLAYRLHGKEHR
jgi:hypothetical protein